MKRIVFILSVILLLTPINAQEKESFKGKKALLFSFNGLNLGSADGGIGSKFWISEKVVLTGNIGFSHSKEKEGYTTEEEYEEKDSKNTSISFGLEIHKILKNKITPYIGLSLGISKPKTKQKGMPAIEEREYTTSSKFANFSFGMEFFIIKSISLATQYNLKYSYSKIKRTDTIGNNIHEWNEIHKSFGISASYLTLCIYF